jgi:heat shock protein HtpX
MQAYGLYTHIQANRLRSALLLLGFVGLLQALLYSFLIIGYAFTSGADLPTILELAARRFAVAWPVAMGAALLWFVVAFFIQRALIRTATGSRGVTREEAPQLYNCLENLCISRGLPTPALEIIDTPGLNAFASGIRQSDYTITVTRGLIDTLTPAELETVLGHELTHIRNKDVQLMVIAVIFAGIFGFFGDLIVRGWNFPYGWSPTPRGGTGPWGTSQSSGGGNSSDGSSSGDSDKRDNSGAALIAIVIAVAIILISWGLSTLIRFALSRSREYLADAGSVELTKNPDALIAALRKIAADPHVEVPSRMEAFFIENPVRASLSGFFDTHPSIESRIAALERYAGGHESPVSDDTQTGPWSKRAR